MKPLIFLLGLMCLSMYSNAQKKTEDIVYLKNGSVIHGAIIEIIPTETLKIQTADHSIFIFKMDEVDRIAEGPPDYFEKKKNSYVNIFDIGYLIASGQASMEFNGHSDKHDNEYEAYSVRDVNGFLASKNFILGIGIGYENYTSSATDFLPKTEYIPLFIDLRSFNGSKSTSAYFACDLGYKFGLTKTSATIYDDFSSTLYTVDDEFKGGLFVNPALGVRIQLNMKFALHVSIGYEFQNCSIIEEVKATHQGVTEFGVYDLSLHTEFINFRIGIEL